MNNFSLSMGQVISEKENVICLHQHLMKKMSDIVGETSLNLRII